jgi:hypothetical protein
VKWRTLRAAVDDRDLHQHVLLGCLGVLDRDVEVPVVVEDAGVDQLEFGIVARTRTIARDQFVVREGPLRVLVEHPHVGMGGRRVEVEVVLLDVLAVIALGPGQSEEALLEDRVLSVPHGQCQADLLLAIADAGNAVLVPPIGPRTGVIVREVLPGPAVLAVVLAHGAPGPFAQIGPPSLPVRLPLP